MSYFTEIGFSDTGAKDAFGRLRVSEPNAILAVQNQYKIEKFKLEVGATGTGVTPVHNANTRMVDLVVNAGTGTGFVQSYQYSPYKPGHSQFIAMTGVIGTAVADVNVDFGYADSANGVFLRQNGTTNYQLGIRSSTSGSPVETLVAQSSWNIDKFDGTGVSGVNLDFTKGQILMVDLQFLSMGRVRVGFDVNGVLYYAHEFLNANNLAVPYMQTATLPVSMVVSASASAGAKSCSFKCCTVISEGGAINDDGLHFVTPEVSITAGSGTRTPAISFRPKTTFNGFTNRSMGAVENVYIFNTGNQDAKYELVLGATLSGAAYSDVNDESAYEYSSTAGTFTNLTGGYVIETGFVKSGQVHTFELPFTNALEYPLTLDRA